MKKLILFITCAVMLCACGGSKPQPQEESKSLPVSTLTLKGKHACLFEAAGKDYKVNLVQTDNGWQVRVKMTLETKTDYDDLKDWQNYVPELTSINGELINSSDVEMESLDMDAGSLDALVSGDSDEDEATVSGRTWSYKHLSYEDAKALYDKTAGVELSGIELKKVEKPGKGGSSKIFDDETQETLDDMKDLLEAEGELINALGGLF